MTFSLVPRLRVVALVLGFLSALATSLRAADWPQWLGPQRDGVWRETGIVETLPTNGFTYRWRTPIGGGYSGPAVANGRVYLMDRQLATGTTNPANAFARGTIPGAERILCLNEADGKIVWQHSYDCAYTVSYASGPRVTLAAPGLPSPCPSYFPPSPSVLRNGWMLCSRPRNFSMDSFASRESPTA
jgi:outer membrane protein assembly factor BamB